MAPCLCSAPCTSTTIENIEAIEGEGDNEVVAPPSTSRTLPSDSRAGSKESASSVGSAEDLESFGTGSKESRPYGSMGSVEFLEQDANAMVSFDTPPDDEPFEFTIRRHAHTHIGVAFYMEEKQLRVKQIYNTGAVTFANRDRRNKYGLLKGDIVLTVNGHTDAKSMLADIKESKKLRFRVHRHDGDQDGKFEYAAA